MPLKTYNDEFKIAAAKLGPRAGLHRQAGRQEPGRRPGLDPRLGPQVRPGSGRSGGRRLGRGTPTREPAAPRGEPRLLMEREILKKATAFFAKEQP